MNEEERRAAVYAALDAERVRHSMLIARLEDGGQAETVPDIVTYALASIIAYHFGRENQQDNQAASNIPEPGRPAPA